MNPTKLQKTHFLSHALFLGIALPLLPSCVTDRGEEEEELTLPSATSNRQVELEDGAPLVVVNEFMASNDTSITDEGGTTADWIELYNLSDEDIDLAGFFISDDKSIPTKALLAQGTIIEAHSTFLLWADGDTWQGPQHLPFKLKKQGRLSCLRLPWATCSTSSNLKTQPPTPPSRAFPTEPVTLLIALALHRTRLMILLAEAEREQTRSDPARKTHTVLQSVGPWNGFEVARRELLKERELLTRVDRKFVASIGQVDMFLRGLRDHYHILLAGGAGWARYETCYFDTPDLLAFHEHIRGRRPRVKVRIRHHLDRRRSFLEVKRKTNAGKTEKVRMPRSFGDSFLSPNDRSFIGDHCSLPVDTLNQTVWTNFRRATFVGVHSNERITVDVGLTFLCGAWPQETVEFGIIELKQPRISHNTPAALLLREFGVREQSLSKYCVGVAKAHENARPWAKQLVSRKVQRIKA